ncbi:hypothetical protein ACKC9G_14415 [Pokkaliibacter sp. CJK22405]|uniref:hypothetical protein n=1 Tax=Pokkaliibacter sp. CJK22405 TaxID=3384615 RepID=UPI003985587E
MSKFVRAVNVMISNSGLIKNVIKGSHEGELFFKYDYKHSWSIWKGEDNSIFMSYYPPDQDIQVTARVIDLVGVQCITYSSRELGTREARDSMAELYQVVSEKAYGMDEVLDDIIDTDPDPLPF